MDELKKYLQQNREALDADVPGNDMWQRINEQPVTKKVPAKIVRPGFKFAAAAAVIIAIVFAAKWIMKDDSITIPSKEITKQNIITPKTNIDTAATQNTTTTQQNSLVSLHLSNRSSSKKQQPSQSTLLKELQNNYGLLVKMELNSIRSTPVYGEAPGYFSEFKTMLNQMDADEILVRNNIKTSGLTAVSLEQLINIYQKKLDLLKSLHTEIEKMNNKVKQAPSVDTLSSYFITI